MPRRRNIGMRLRKDVAIFFFGIIIFVLHQLKLTTQYYYGGSGGGQHHDDIISPDYSSYHIHLVKDSLFATTNWDHISKIWTSNSTYSDIWTSTQTVDALPSSLTQQSSKGRTLFILHNHPKMASTTLRRSCWENLRRTCDVVSRKRDQVGYSNANDLSSLIKKCKNTHHLCVMGWHYNAENFPDVTTSNQTLPIRFIHLFPFRNFYDWSASAMKQVFVGHSKAGCNELDKRLETCDGGWLELDMNKYSKHTLKQMFFLKQQKSVDTHHFILYDYSQVQQTLSQLSKLCQVPMMPNLDMQYKSIRQGLYISLYVVDSSSCTSMFIPYQPFTVSISCFHISCSLQMDLVQIGHYKSFMSALMTKCFTYDITAPSVLMQ